MNRSAAFALVFLLAAPATADTISDAKSAISAQMLDPKSVQWRNLRNVTSVDGDPAVCGELLAKNYFGAYIGWQQFVWIRGELLTSRKMQELGIWGVPWPSVWALCL